MNYLQVLLLFLCLFSTVNSVSFSDTIISLTKSHDFEGKSEDEVEDEEFAHCINNQRNPLQSVSVYGPFYKFMMEGSFVSLPCSPCYYTSRPYPTWVKLTFDNEHIEIDGNDTDNTKYQIQHDDTLLITGAEVLSDYATYYCEMNGFVGNIWTLEPESFEQLKFVAAKKWEVDEAARVDYFPGIQVGIEWEPWEPCNKCDYVGKRHRIGYCKVQKADENLDTDLEPSPTPNFYSALNLYPDGLSCNLFFLLHGSDPHGEVGQNLAIERSLMRGPYIMLNFCKVPCANLEFDPHTKFTNLHPAIREFYKHDLREVGDAQKLSNEFNEHFREHESGKFFGATPFSLASLIPERMPTTFEWCLLWGLLLLQAYIAVHIWKNRSKAN